MRINNSCLAMVKPNIAKEWHPTKNGILTPYDVTYGSTKKIWWLCREGHEWEASINNRTKKKGTNCRFCFGSCLKEKNSLANTFPEIREEWDFCKNGNLSLDDVSYGCNTRIWLICKKGHSWDTTVNNRTSGYSCPYCSGRKVCKDNCLAVLRPDIAVQWHPVLNGQLTPNDVTEKSGKRVWWLCGNGHESFTAVYSRSNGHICPLCLSGSSVSKLSQKWLDSLNIPVENREHYFKDLGYKVDAFVPETNTVYEFLGNYWHGNPGVFDLSDTNKTVSKTFGELYEETKTRISRLEEAGYKVIFIWEYDFLK